MRILSGQETFLIVMESGPGHENEEPDHGRRDEYPGEFACEPG